VFRKLASAINLLTVYTDYNLHLVVLYKCWASWWSKPEHLKVLCAPFADMSAETWEIDIASHDKYCGKEEHRM